MSDIVERLRLYDPTDNRHPAAALCQEAAAEIERLRFETERLKERVASLNRKLTQSWQDG